MHGLPHSVRTPTFDLKHCAVLQPAPPRRKNKPPDAPRLLTCCAPLPCTAKTQEYVLGGLTYDTVLVAMSDLYDAVRQAEEAASSQAQAAGPGEAWVPPDEFKRWGCGGRSGQQPRRNLNCALPYTPSGSLAMACRSTTKFWVDPRDVLRVKAAIVRHLPVLIFGRR